MLGHAYIYRLSNEEKTLLDQMTKNMIMPSQVLLTIKSQDETNLSTIKSYTTIQFNTISLYQYLVYIIRDSLHIFSVDMYMEHTFYFKIMLLSYYTTKQNFVSFLLCC